MIEGFADLIDSIEDQRKTLEVHTDSDDTAATLATQFSTRNVAVTHQYLPSKSPAFVVIRESDGSFRGALGVDTLEAIVSPDIHPPWELAETDVDLGVVLEFLDGTMFTSFERRQLLAVSREFEERAWRVGTGRLYVGFQRPAALAAQIPVYNRLARERDLAITAFLDESPKRELADAITVHATDSHEIGRYWFLAFDGGTESDIYNCALLAEERSDGLYRGFWTDDPACVAELCTYLRTRYGV